MTTPLPSSHTIIHNPVNMLRANGSLHRSRRPNHHNGRMNSGQRHSSMGRRQSTNPASSASTNEENPFSDSRSYGSYGQITGVIPVIVAPNNAVSQEPHGRPALTNETGSAFNFSTTESLFTDLLPPESVEHDAAASWSVDSETLDTPQYGQQHPDYMEVDYMPGSLNGAGNPASEQSWSKTSGKPCPPMPYADHHG